METNSVSKKEKKLILYYVILTSVKNRKMDRVRTLGGQPCTPSLPSNLCSLQLRSRVSRGLNSFQASLFSLFSNYRLLACCSNSPNPSQTQDLCTALSLVWLFFPRVFPSLAPSPQSGLSSNVPPSGRPLLTLLLK